LVNTVDPPGGASEHPVVRIAAAEALWRHGSESDRQLAAKALVQLADWSKHDVFTVMAALGTIDPWDPRDRSLAEQLLRLPTTGPLPHPRYANYVPRLIETLRHSLTP
jgi:hypothetical protein